MSYKITKDDEAYWLQIDGKKSALIRLESVASDGVICGAIKEAYEAEHPEEFRKPPRIYDYRDVELPEVKALVGKRVYASDILFDIINVPCGIKKLLEADNARTYPFRVEGPVGAMCKQFIRAIDKPKTKITRAELIAIAAKSRGVKPEQIVVEG